MNNLFAHAYQESCKNFQLSMLGLDASVTHCNKIGIKNLYLFEETEAFDALIIKLTRNADIFFQQIIKGFFKLKGEDRLLFIDRLNMLAKMQIIKDCEVLLNLKSFRNQAVHEYSSINFHLLYQEALMLAPLFKNSVFEFFVYLENEHIFKSI